MPLGKFEDHRRMRSLWLSTVDQWALYIERDSLLIVDGLTELSDDIKAAVYKHKEKIPLALAVGVIEIVKKDIIEACE